MLLSFPDPSCCGNVWLNRRDSGYDKQWGPCWRRGLYFQTFSHFTNQCDQTGWKWWERRKICFREQNLLKIAQVFTFCNFFVNFGLIWFFGLFSFKLRWAITWWKNWPLRRLQTRRRRWNCGINSSRRPWRSRTISGLLLSTRINTASDTLENKER